MKSTILGLLASSAVSLASECQYADETTLLQGRSLVRLKTEAKKTTDAKVLLESLRDVANSLTEGSDSTMSRDEVNEALDAASEALAELSPVIRQQVEMAQQQVIHASAAVEACHEGAEVTAGLRQSAVQHGVAVDNCEEDLETAIAAEQEACQRAEDCLCDEARTALSGQQALCASVTETYEVAYCEHFVVCTMTHQCHTTEVQVYNTIRADIESEIAALQMEYATVEQASCITALIQTAMTPPLTPIPHAQLLACSAEAVDVSAIAVNYPDLPAAPTACSEPTHGHPPCVASPWTLVVQYGTGSYPANSGAVGTPSESETGAAKLSDADINALPQGGGGAYTYYKLTSDSATAGETDSLILRTTGTYNDLVPGYGLQAEWAVCLDSSTSVAACTQWSSGNPTNRIDTLPTNFPDGNDCDRWFTGYNGIMCFAANGVGHARDRHCWSHGHVCSLGSHAIRLNMKMYKCTGDC